MRRKRKRTSQRKPELSISQILAWADDFYVRIGRWPHAKLGVIPRSLGENWNNVDSALRNGFRGLPGGTTLSRLLSQHRGKRDPTQLPPLTVKQILSWADGCYKSTGRWPHAALSRVADGMNETWKNVDMALRVGYRGLPGGTTLARLLTVHRGKRNPSNLPRFTVRRILAWADAHYRRTGRWPTLSSGPIAEAPGETWLAVNQALSLGCRGFPGGSSLPQMLARKRGKRHLMYLPRLTVKRILAMADQYVRIHGRWPKRNSGPVRIHGGGTWYGINTALIKGCRGLPGGISLAQLLAAKRAVRNQGALPALRKKAILAWASDHFKRTGAWPTRGSGLVYEAPGETWAGINVALNRGYRGLPGGTSLAQLLAQGRNLRKGR